MFFVITTYFGEITEMEERENKRCWIRFNYDDVAEYLGIENNTMRQILFKNKIKLYILDDLVNFINFIKSKQTIDKKHEKRKLTEKYEKTDKILGD